MLLPAGVAMLLMEMLGLFDSPFCDPSDWILALWRRRADERRIVVPPDWTRGQRLVHVLTNPLLQLGVQQFSGTYVLAAAAGLAIPEWFQEANPYVRSVEINPRLFRGCAQAFHFNPKVLSSFERLRRLAIVGVLCPVQLLSIHYYAPRLARLTLTHVGASDIWTALPLLSHLEELELLFVHAVTSFRAACGLGRLRSLTLLVESSMYRITDIACLGELPPLEKLVTDGQWDASQAECEMALQRHVETLHVVRCLNCTGRLSASWFVGRAKRLRELWLDSCESTVDVDVGLYRSGLTPQLVHLRVGESLPVQDLSPLSCLVSLESLQVSVDPACRDCSPIGELRGLRSVEIRRGLALCGLVEQVEIRCHDHPGAVLCAIACLPSVKRLAIVDCPLTGTLLRNLPGPFAFVGLLEELFISPQNSSFPWPTVFPTWLQQAYRLRVLAVPSIFRWHTFRFPDSLERLYMSFEPLRSQPFRYDFTAERWVLLPSLRIAAFNSLLLDRRPVHDELRSDRCQLDSLEATAFGSRVPRKIRHSARTVSVAQCSCHRGPVRRRSWYLERLGVSSPKGNCLWQEPSERTESNNKEMGFGLTQTYFLLTQLVH